MGGVGGCGAGWVEYLKAVSLYIFGPVFPGLPAETDPQNLLGSPGPAPHVNFHENSVPQTDSNAKRWRTRNLPRCLKVYPEVGAEESRMGKGRGLWQAAGGRRLLTAASTCRRAAPPTARPKFLAPLPEKRAVRLTRLLPPLAAASYPPLFSLAWHLPFV